MSGRVDVQSGSFEMYHLFKEQRAYANAGEEAIRSIHSKNELSDVFFSRANIDAVQEGIRYQVYKKSCGSHVIDKQSETDLLIVMRAIYLQYGNHRPYKLLDQVKQLNQVVIDYCVPKILEEIKLYLYYRKDISALPVPMERGEFISSKGTKVLEQKF